MQRWLQPTTPTHAARPTGDSFISISVQSDMTDSLQPGNDDIVTPPSPPLVSCIPMPLPLPGGVAGSLQHRAQAALPAKRVQKLQFGLSGTQPVLQGTDSRDVKPNSYQEADHKTFNLRTKDYMKTKQKAPSRSPLYKLVNVDVYSTHAKHWHIVRRMQLPRLPRCARCPVEGVSLDEMDIPPLLVLHIMMPLYPGTFFATTDGPNCSFVYFFRLPDDFSVSTFHTPEVCCTHVSIRHDQ
jgi:Protein ENHANCED DISEASE RESISTANCE 2, C-terminal